MEMSSVDLNENMTSEDIAAFADTIAKEAESERKGSPDVESVDNEQAENISGSKSAEVESQSEDTSDESAIPEWVDDKVKAEVAAYGISESELAEFSNREEMEKFLRLFDKRALETGRKAMSESEEGSARNEKGQFVKKQEQQEEDKAPSAANKSGNRFEISLSKELYDDEIVDEFSRMRDHYESRLEALESHFAQASSKAEEERFDSYIDSLGHAELFGKTGSESPQELERRKDVHVAVMAHMIGLDRLGRPTELSDQLVKRVANMVFSEELSKKQLKQQTQKVFKQNQLRQGGSPTKPLPPRENPRDEFDRLYRELERS
jgi:hypothetical protein